MCTLEEKYKLVYKVYNDKFKKFHYIKDDLIQEAINKITSNDVIYDSTKGTESTFFYKVAKNTMLDLVRKTKIHESRFTSVKDLEYGTEDLFEEKEDKMLAYDIASNVLRQYPETKKNIVSDFMNGYSYNEIAEERNVSHQYAQKVIDGFFIDCKKISPFSCDLTV